MAQPLLTALGKTTVLAGATMDDSVATMAPFDLRYVYISGGIFDSPAPCTSCASGCTANGTTCANSGPGCSWWGCWQYDQVPPGNYARAFDMTAATDGQFPMFTYYQILQASGATEGSGEVMAANNATFMSRYFADWRFLLQQIGTRTAFLHIEPDFWGYAEHVNSDPHAIPAAVASANATDCASQENSIAGMGRCMISMVRSYAPNAKVGLHASPWGTGIDVNINSDPTLDVAQQGRVLGQFLLAVGAGSGDFIVVEASDRDAGYYASIGQNRWWDATNATLPDFVQALAWAKSVSETVALPNLWWQVPVGNAAQTNVCNHYQDNRVDYFMTHVRDVASAHGFGLAFGAGASCQTTPSTDGGNLLSRVNAYATSGRVPACP